MMRQDAPSSGWAGMDAQARKEFWASLALRHCKGLGALSAARLLQTFGSAHAAFQARDQWHKAGLHRGQVAEMATGSWRVTARAEWEAAQRIDARILLWHDSQYPERLRTLPDAPVLLYCKGDLELLSTPAVAVIGTRQPSPHARTVAVHMAQNLSACGICVVSGMAQGIDGLSAYSVQALGKSILGRIRNFLPGCAMRACLFRSLPQEVRLCRNISPSAIASSAGWLWRWW